MIDVLRAPMAEPRQAPPSGQFQMSSSISVATPSLSTCTSASGIPAPTITSAAEVAGLLCDVYPGDLTIAIDAGEGHIESSLSFILGDLSIQSTNEVVDSISFANLGKVTGALNLNGQFANWGVTVSFPELASLGSLDISSTNLHNFTLSNLTSIESISITSNPVLTSIALSMMSLKNIKISNNTGCPWVYVDNLVTVNKSASIEKAGGFQASGLRHVEGDLVFKGNNFQNLALDDLRTVSGSLNITNSYDLAFLSLQDLESVGMPGDSSVFAVTPSTPENAVLFNITLPSLATVNGAIDFEGNLTEIEMLKLNKVTGSLNIQDNKANGSALCTSVLQSYGSQLPTVPITCDGKSIHATATTNSTSTATNPASTSKSKGLVIGAKVGIGIGAALFGVAVLLVIALVLVHKYKQRLTERQGLSADQPKNLDYSPMIGDETATSIPLSQYQDSSAEERNMGFATGDGSGSSANLNTLRAVPLDDRPVSPISMGEQGLGGSRSGSVSPVSIGRLSLRDGHERGLAM